MCRSKSREQSRSHEIKSCEEFFEEETGTTWHTVFGRQLGKVPELKKFDLRGNQLRLDPTGLVKSLIKFSVVPELTLLRLSDNPFCAIFPEYQAIICGMLCQCYRMGMNQLDDVGLLVKSRTQQSSPTSCVTNLSSPGGASSSLYEKYLRGGRTIRSEGGRMNRMMEAYDYTHSSGSYDCSLRIPPCRESVTFSLHEGILGLQSPSKISDGHVRRRNWNLSPSASSDKKRFFCM